MLTTHLATSVDVSAVQALARLQTATFYRMDPRLPDDALLPTWMVMPPGGSCWLAREDGHLVAALVAEPEHWPAESPFASVFPRDYLRLRFIWAGEGNPEPILDTLLERVDGWFGALETSGRMLLLPGVNDRLNTALRAEGFRPYHIIANQAMPTDWPQTASSDLRVRPAQEDDVSAVAALIAESWRFHAEYQPAIEVSPYLLPGCRQQARQMIGDGVRQTMLLATCHDDVVGFFAVGLSAQDPTVRPALFERGHYGDIYEVGVKVERRRHGVGTAMYYAALDWFRRHEVRGVFVNYAPTNPISSRFWPRLGFVDAWINWWRA